MRKLFLLLSSALLVLAVSCNKDGLEAGKVRDGETCRLTLNVRVEGNDGTKAASASGTAITDGLKTIDFFVYDDRDSAPIEHSRTDVTSVEDLTYTIEASYNETRGFFAIGNIDEATANEFAEKSPTELASTDSSCVIFWNAGNFEYDRVPMEGGASYTFKEDGNITLLMKRVFYRIDVQKITVAFDDEELRGQEVILKDIVLGNVPGYFKPIRYIGTLSSFNEFVAMFSVSTELTNAFGGIETGYNYMSNTLPLDHTYNMTGEGNLTGTFKSFYNCSYMQPAGVLIKDADGVAGECTIQSYSDSEGLIVAEGNTAESNSIEVDRCFYAPLGTYTTWIDNLVTTFYGQPKRPMLIIHLTIGGTDYFYPIGLTYMQPNTVYRIPEITVKSVGSLYANFYEKKFQLTMGVEIVDWFETDVEDMIVGYDPETGKMLEES